MTIAVQIDLSELVNDTADHFNYQCFSILARKHPNHHFLFIFDRPFDPLLIKYPNITPVVLLPQMKNGLLQHYWYNYKLPRLILKYNAGLFISSCEACSLRMDIDQCIIIHDPSNLQKNNRGSKKGSRYLRKFTRQFAEKAAYIFTFNHSTRHQIDALIPPLSSKTCTIQPGIANDAVPLLQDKKENLKNSITGGVEYFLYYSDSNETAHTLIVLKAFSIFKKWQQSNMQLILMLNDGQIEKIQQLLLTYKFRKDIQLFPVAVTEKFEEINGAAYAMIFLPEKQITETKIGISLKRKVPVIVPDLEYYRSGFGDAVTFCAINEKSVSDKMMLLYKDETYRNQLISKGAELAAARNWENAADQLWNSINPVSE